MNQNPSSRDTKEQVWTARVCETCGHWWKPRSNAVGINCPQCNRQTVTDIEVIPLTIAKEQVEAAEKAASRVFEETQGKLRTQHRAEQAESERDTALERVEQLEKELESERANPR